MTRLSIGVFALGALPLLGCTDTKDGPPSAGEATNISSYELRIQLPLCTLLNIGQVYYVASETAFYYCDGQRMRDLALSGAPQANWRVALRPAAVTDCPNGGTAILVGPDTNGDGSLSATEVVSTANVCNGKDGANGTNGTNGTNGKDARSFNSLVEVSDAPLSACPAGGTQLQVGIDDGRAGGIAGDGILQAGELDSTTNVCNGVDGANGADDSLSHGNANAFEATDAWGLGWDGFARPAAAWDVAAATCRAAGARLPTATELYRLNYASGSGLLGDGAAMLWTLLNQGATSHIEVRLSDGAVGTALNSGKTAFRCVWPGATFDQFTAGACNGPLGAECFSVNTQWNVDKVDRVSLPYSAALQECALAHATVPSARLLTEAVRAGLPNGSDNQQWTSAHEGYNSSGFLLGTLHWSGTNRNFDATYPNSASWDYYTAGYAHPFRCAGLKATPIANPSAPATAFTDPTSQLVGAESDAPGAGFMQAVADCRARAGHLPGQRDLGRLIVAGLPAGSGNWLWTSEAMYGSSASGPNTGAVRWLGVDRFFDDTYPTYATWLARSTTPSPYRCVWYPLDASAVAPDASSCSGGCFESTVTIGASSASLWADNADRPAASRATATSTCSALGGRLASFRDFAELIVAGLPNGRSSWLWTSSLARYELVHGVKWTGTAPAWSDAFNNQSTVLPDQSNSVNPYRCVWTNEIID